MADHTNTKQTLEETMKTLVEELETIASYNEENGDWVAIPVAEDLGSADDNMAADATEEWGNRRALVSQLEMRFHSVKLALQKYVDGTYGYCEMCNEPIEEDRLAINPAARTCKVHMERERELPL
jgi:DnaK suppressor protein